MKKRVLSMLLAVILSIGLLPTTTFANAVANDDTSPSRTCSFVHNEREYILALAAYNINTGFDLRAPLITNGGEEFWIMEDIPLEDQISDTYYPVVFNCEESNGETVFSVNTVLTAAITSVVVSSSVEDVISVEVGAKDAYGFPIVKCYYEEEGEAIIITTVAIDGVEQEIVLQQTDSVVNTDPLVVYVEKGSELAAQLSTAEGFNEYLNHHAWSPKQLYLHLYEGFSVEGTIIVPNSVRIFGHGATIKGNLDITRGAIIENGNLVEPYPATVVLDGLNFVYSNVGESTAITGAGATLALSGCSITGYDVGIDTTYENGGLSLDMSGNRFIDNHTALDIQTSLMGRRFWANYFEGNNVAINLSGDAEDMLYATTFYHCVFKQNAQVVRNETAGTFYIPRCLYLNHNDQAVKPTSPGKFHGDVIYTPYYYEAHPDILDIEKSANYQGQTITGGISNLNMKLSVASNDLNTGELEEQLASGPVVIEMKGDEQQELYQWEISSAEETIQPAMYRMRLMTLEAPEEKDEVLSVTDTGSFNPVVEIETVDEYAQKIIVGNFEFTENTVNAVLSIPFAGQNAPMLLRDGKAMNTTVSDGKVSFAVTESGEYLLANGGFTVVDTPASCAADGYRTYTYAGEDYIVKTEAAIGHDFSNIFRPTCTNCNEPNPNYVPPYIPPVIAEPKPDEEPEPIPDPIPTPMPVPEVPVNPFYDVAESDYYYDAVLWAIDNDVTSGSANDTFAPEQDCDRAQVVTFLWRAAGSPDPVGAGNTFTDVEHGSYYEKAVQWAVENGITNGIGDGSFGTDDVVTRAQIVTFLWRAAGCPIVESTVSFDDVPSDAYYAEAVLWAAENGITLGDGNNHFNPNDNCTRAQVVTFLYRYFAK